MTFRRFTLAALMAGLVLAGIGAASAQSYTFTIDPAASGLTANPQVKLAATGSLIGNYIAKTNPNGTRTKSGLFGSFGSTENLPVKVAPAFTVSGKAATTLSGDFTLAFDLTKKSVTISDYTVSLLGTQPITLTGSVVLNSAAFRTRNPTFLYPSFKTPISGSLSTKNFSVTQSVIDSRSGTLTAVGTNSYHFTLVFPVVASLTLTLNGQTETAHYSTSYTLSGKVVFSGSKATVTTDKATNVTFGGPVSYPIAPFAVSLPTVSSSSAHVVVSLTATQASLTLNGSYSLTADGVKD